MEQADWGSAPVRWDEVQPDCRSKQWTPRDRPGCGNIGKLVLATTGHLAKERRIYSLVFVVLDRQPPYRLNEQLDRAVEPLGV